MMNEQNTAKKIKHEKVNEFSEAIKDRRPILAKILDENKDLSLEEYASHFKEKNLCLADVALQSGDDFINICADYAERITGLNIGERVRKRLTENHNILTANHHGPLFCNIQLQGQILFALGENPRDIMPVFAFGDIPLNNATYPRGITLNTENKLSLFPDSMKNSLVSFVDSYKKENVERSINKVEKLFHSGQLTSEEYEAARMILTDIFLDKKVLKAKTYSDQSVLINMKLWNILCSKLPEALPGIAYFEIEKIVSKLLCIDLNNEESLIYNIFFREDLRNNLFRMLDEAYGCWDLSKLEAMLINDIDSTAERRMLLAGSGTIFFWGIDPKKRRFPLYLTSKFGALYLTGKNDSLEYYEVKFEPGTILKAISDQQLLPSLFTSFCVISFARNYICFGGFMQADYLTVMKNGLVDALNSCQLVEQAESISNIPTENYCTGLQFILYKRNDIFCPAGTFSLISKGCLNKERLNIIKNISLKNADLLGLPVKYPAVYRKAERIKEFEDLSVNDVYLMLQDKDSFMVL